MARNAQKPTRTPVDSPIADAISTHPAFGMISAHRINGGFDLFGSSITSNGAVMLTLSAAEMYHSNGIDTPMARKAVVELVLSEAQWVGLISRMNMGSGVPCTYRMKPSGPTEHIPGIPQQPPAAERLRGRADEMLAESARKQDAAYGLAQAALRDSGLSAKKAAPIFSALAAMHDHGQTNRRYQTDVLHEHTEKLVVEAKVELQAAVSNVVTQLGAAALQQQGSIAMPSISIDHEEG